MQLILASASPRRAELLDAAGYVFETLAVDIDERVQEGERPEEYVQRLAGEKSAKAAGLARGRASANANGNANANANANDRYVLGADTAVVIDGDILGKPSSDEAARTMLRRLSGRRHEVLTGVSLRRLGAAGAALDDEVGCVEATAVYFIALRDADIEWYVQSGEGVDKAGGYAIQGLGSRFVQRIEGSYSNVVGLPVVAVDELIRQLSDRRI